MPEVSPAAGVTPTTGSTGGIDLVMTALPRRDTPLHSEPDPRHGMSHRLREYGVLPGQTSGRREFPGMTAITGARVPR